MASLAAFHAPLLLLCRCRFILLIYRHYLCLEILLKLFLAPLSHPRNAEMPGTLVSSCTSHLAPQGCVSQQQDKPQTFLGLYPIGAWSHLHLVLTFPKSSITLLGSRAAPQGATTTSSPPCCMRWGLAAGQCCQIQVLEQQRPPGTIYPHPTQMNECAGIHQPGLMFSDSF